MSAAAGRAWVVAASMGAVEALKDQGFARWNYAMRMLNQHAKSNIRSYSQAQKLSGNPSSSAMIGNRIRAKRREEKMKKVMDLNCWGPTTVRF